MEITEPILNAVVENFPDHTQEIIRHFVESESFRDICEDYVLCFNMVRRNMGTNVENDKYLEDYKIALEALEMELLSNLK